MGTVAVLMLIVGTVLIVGLGMQDVNDDDGED